jgi:hypothetical protein
MHETEERNNNNEKRQNATNIKCGKNIVAAMLIIIKIIKIIIIIIIIEILKCTPKDVKCIYQFMSVCCKYFYRVECISAQNYEFYIEKIKQ